MPKLAPAQLRSVCSPESFDFVTTADVDDLDEIVGQSRAIEAIRFGIGMGGQGFNIFAMGPSGIGKHHVLRLFLEDRAPDEPTPPSWCYVHNFDAPTAPRAIAMMPGQATAARDAVDRLIGDLEVAIRAALESDEFRARRRILHTEFDARHQDALEKVAQLAEGRGFSLEQTATGFVLVPLIEGTPATDAQLAALDEEATDALQAAQQEIELELRAAVDQFPTWERERHHALLALQGEYVAAAVRPLFNTLREDFAHSDDFVDHLDALQESLIDDPSPFLGLEDEEDLPAPPELVPSLGVERFTVNVVVDHAPGAGAPIVYEDDPTFENLHGRVEYDTSMGGLTTNFALIRSGSLHDANGGYLVIDARKLLVDPDAWGELKRSLYAEEIRVASRTETTLAPRALSLDPDPIPLDVKVILVGERETYYALRELDPDMDELFKVMADFDEHIPRSPDSERTYARFVATIARTDGLRPFTRAAVARIVDEGARLAGHARRLSTHMRLISDLLAAGDHWAAADRVDHVDLKHVEKAIAMQEARNGRLRDAMLEEVVDGLINVATSGEAVGEINGLSVIQFGASTFGRPTRISVAVSPGRDVIDIEREVELGGPIHSKGVMLLTGFLAHRYGAETPLALSATIAFEQSYNFVDGDSASAAEACALLSALAEVPIRQSAAITGAIDQRGRIQSVGGVEAKIEGFFDLCCARGLTGDHFAIIPNTNVAGLMVDQRVIDAVAAARFAIHAVASIDEAMELLTGLTPAELDTRVRARLSQFAAAWRTAGGLAGL